MWSVVKQIIHYWNSDQIFNQSRLLASISRKQEKINYQHFICWLLAADQQSTQDTTKNSFWREIKRKSKARIYSFNWNSVIIQLISQNNVDSTCADSDCLSAVDLWSIQHLHHSVSIVHRETDHLAPNSSPVQRTWSSKPCGSTEQNLTSYSSCLLL